MSGDGDGHRVGIGLGLALDPPLHDPAVRLWMDAAWQAQRRLNLDFETLFQGALRAYSSIGVFLDVVDGVDFGLLQVRDRASGEPTVVMSVPGEVLRHRTTADRAMLQVLSVACHALDLLIEKEEDLAIQRQRQPARARPLARTSFWRMIDRARVEAPDVDGVVLNLAEQLAEATTSSVVGFHLRLIDVVTRLDTSLHREAAELIHGFASDDFFLDWRAWVVTRGRAAYESVLADADALADLLDLEDGHEGAEQALEVAASVYAQRTGNDLDLGPLYEHSEAGRSRRDPDAICADLPRLATRFPDDGLGQPPRR